MSNTGNKAKTPYFVQGYNERGIGTEFQLREDHELLYGIEGGSGLLASFKTREEAQRECDKRNAAHRTARS